MFVIMHNLEGCACLLARGREIEQNRRATVGRVTDGRACCVDCRRHSGIMTAIQQRSHTPRVGYR